MSKKEILGLPTPAVVFIWVAKDLFLYANLYTPTERINSGLRCLNWHCVR